MFKFAYLPFRWKLTFIIMAACFLTLCTACVMFVGYENYVFRQALIKDVENLTSILIENKSAIATSDKDTIQSLLSSLRNEEHILVAAVYTPEEPPEVLGRYQ